MWHWKIENLGQWMGRPLFSILICSTELLNFARLSLKVKFYLSTNNVPFEVLTLDLWMHQNFHDVPIIKCNFFFFFTFILTIIFPLKCVRQLPLHSNVGITFLMNKRQEICWNIYKNIEIENKCQKKKICKSMRNWTLFLYSQHPSV